LRTGIQPASPFAGPNPGYAGGCRRHLQKRSGVQGRQVEAALEHKAACPVANPERLAHRDQFGHAVSIPGVDRRLERFEVVQVDLARRPRALGCKQGDDRPPRDPGSLDPLVQPGLVADQVDLHLVADFQDAGLLLLARSDQDCQPGNHIGASHRPILRSSIAPRRLP
jgi:hypothetical protein